MTRWYPEGVDGLTLLNRYLNGFLALLHAEMLVLYDEPWGLRLFRVVVVAVFVFFDLNAWGVKWRLERKSVATPKSQSAQSTTIGKPVQPSSPPPSGPILGWRMFRCQWARDGYKLHSVVVDTEWDGPVAQDSEAPNDAAFGRGAYANYFSFGDRHSRVDGVGFFSVRDKASPKLNEYGAGDPVLASTRHSDGEQVYMVRECRVLAQVECFGGIVEHEEGWRSQGQIIRKLYAPCADVVADLERRYQCDVSLPSGQPSLSSFESVPESHA